MNIKVEPTENKSSLPNNVKNFEQLMSEDILLQPKFPSDNSFSYRPTNTFLFLRIANFPFHANSCDCCPS